MTLSQRTQEVLHEFLSIDKIENIKDKRDKLEYFIIHTVLPFCAVNFDDIDTHKLGEELSQAYYPFSDSISLQKNIYIYRTKKNLLVRLLTFLEGKTKQSEIKQAEESSLNPKGKERAVSIITVDKKDIKQKVDDYTQKSQQALEKAEEDFKKQNWDNVVEEGIGSIEFSLKALLIAIVGKYPKTHNFQDKNTKQLYKEAKTTLEKQGKLKEFPNLGRLFFLPNFWGDSYEYSKYGGEYGSSKHLYSEQEARLIIAHAKEELYKLSKLSTEREK
jgi:HEPN domain-containing protein